MYEVAPNGINLDNPEDQIPTGIDIEDFAGKLITIVYNQAVKQDEKLINGMLAHAINCGCGICQSQVNRYMREQDNKYYIPKEP